MSIEQVTCPSCGNPVLATSRFCPECGYNLASYTQATGQLPSLSPGTPTLELGSLSDAQRAQFYESLQSPPPQQQPEVAGPMRAIEPPEYQTPLHGGSLVPLSQDEVAIPPPPIYSDSRMLQPTEFQPAGPIQTYPTFSQPPISYGSYQVQVDNAPPKNPIMGFLLELLGLVGLLGIGHMYSGHVPRGITLMLGWFVYGLVLLLVVFPANLVLSFCTLGTVQCLIYPFIALFLLVPILSGYWAHNELEADVRRGGHR